MLRQERLQQEEARSAWSKSREANGAGLEDAMSEIERQRRAQAERAKKDSSQLAHRLTSHWTKTHQCLARRQCRVLTPEGVSEGQSRQFRGGPKDQVGLWTGSFT